MLGLVLGITYFHFRYVNQYICDGVNIYVLLLNKINGRMSSRIRIDFDIYDSKNEDLITVFDTSDWGLIEEKPSIIEVTPPGFNQPTTLYFDKNNRNIFNSSILEISSKGCVVPLPDGIYKFTVKGSPDKFNKTVNYLRTTNLELKLDKIRVKLVKEYGNNYLSDLSVKLDEIFKFEFLIKSAEAFVRFGYNDKAMDIYKTIVKQLDKIKIDRFNK